MSESEFTRRMSNWVKPSSLPETVLWKMTKGDAVAEARIRVLPPGLELRFFVDGHCYHSQIYRPQEGGTPALYEAALLKRREFEVRGWTLVVPTESERQPQ